MDILCVDIGGGTQDVCYYTGANSFENSIKMVLPAPSKRICAGIASMENDLFIGGGAIGGSELSKILKEKAAAGFNVYMSRRSSASVRDDEDYVRRLGVIVTEDVINPNVVLDEFDYDVIAHVVKNALGQCRPDKVAAAAQDHGHLPGISDRETRFSFLKNFLKNGLDNAFFTKEEDIPENCTRWRSLIRSVKAKCPNSRAHISDTAVIAAIGAASVTNIRPVITVDAGNCHIFAALIGKNDKVYAFFEHHTCSLNPDTAGTLIKKLASCSIDGNEIFENKGHGAYVFEKINAEGCPVLITGPNREKLFSPSGNIMFSYPKGDTMMAGPIGLLIQTGAEL